MGVLTTTPCYLDQSTIGNVVKILFPRRKVSEDVVVKIVGCFGKGQSKPSLATQVRPHSTSRILSRRLTIEGSFTPLAGHGVRHTRELCSAFAVIRGFIQPARYDHFEVFGVKHQMKTFLMPDDRSHLCHLLSFLTRRKHVKPFRIQAL